MLREFQEEIARLKAELASAGDGGIAPANDSSCDAAGQRESESGRQTELLSCSGLDPEEVARMRQQLEEDLRAEYSNGGAELDAATLEQVHGRGL